MLVFEMESIRINHVKFPINLILSVECACLMLYDSQINFIICINESDLIIKCIAFMLRYDNEYIMHLFVLKQFLVLYPLSINTHIVVYIKETLFIKHSI